MATNGSQVWSSGAGTDSPRLRERIWRRFVSGPDPALLEDLYVPALAAAVHYDRCCAYFSSSVLAAAARGFGRLIERLEALGNDTQRPAIRLIVNEELSREDVRHLNETGDVAQLEAHLKRRFKTPGDALQLARLRMLAWLVQRGFLEVRVGVMRRAHGVVHAKYGIVSDRHGDAVVFRGSGNESAQGLLANYEELEISTSWSDPEGSRYFASRFDAVWGDTDPDVHTLPLPEALRQQLIKFAPPEPPILEPTSSLDLQKAAMWFCFIAAAPYLPSGALVCDATALVDLWPHQRHVVAESADAWPEGRLLCDEVGMGKTVEAILVIRRLMAGRGVARMLILLPANLLPQWQAELREKGGLLFPRLEGINTLVWPDGRTERVVSLTQALEQQDFLIMSRETARTENNLPILLSARPWDLVVLDEAHAARRREQEEGEFNRGTLLLTLLRELQFRRQARGFLLLSATPMQTHPWEPWDLLAVLGEGSRWLAEFACVRSYYAAVGCLREGRCDLETARGAARIIAADPRIQPPLWDRSLDLRNRRTVVDTLVFAPAQRRPELLRWLRRSSPLARRMHRNTRETLREYYRRGLLPAAPPTRNITDVVYDFADPDERAVYEAVTTYIDKRFAILEQERPGKGFVMTIYRRRAASSPHALERSLERRREGLVRVIQQRAYDLDLRREEELDFSDLDDLGEVESPGRISAALPADPQVAAVELKEVDQLLGTLRSLGGRDSKRDRFFAELRRITEDGRALLVFTEYTDTMEYLRDQVATLFGTAVGCYSGRGGERWNGSQWVPLTKDEVTRALWNGQIRVLICTDAASEGLNLQAAGAVINYDLPWNPSKVEQRIGRVDRIGQPLSEIQVVNLFLVHSIDERVYRTLGQRCKLFERFVGAMQPVLARARRMLLGHEQVEEALLAAEADKLDSELLAQEAYVESDAFTLESQAPPLTRAALEEALRELPPESGFTVRAKGTTFVVSGNGFKRATVSTWREDLERDPRIIPLTPESALLKKIARELTKTAPRLPLVIGIHQSGPFRACVAVWLDGDKTRPVGSLAELKGLLDGWDGEEPDPSVWLSAQRAAIEEAERLVEHMRAGMTEREEAGLRAQLAAARERLTRELGRYLVTLAPGTSNLNDVFYNQMTKGGLAAVRLRQVFERLGGYPDWSDDLREELEMFPRRLTENQRQARLLGRELDAALHDPRWSVAL